MRLPNHLARGAVGFNMTPMIDVVFLLIVFFLVSSHLARQETQLPLDLPTAQSGQRDMEEDTRRLVVNVLPPSEGDRRILVGGRRVSPGELTDAIRYESRHAPAGQAERPLEVRIRCDRTVPYREVEPILLACASAGVWNVTFAVVAGP
ncbi:MAG: biopolymer transporter ExbD [Pirellulales bacterium]|nr:biopolymer transporter ExbD [Pirellulales bacterium]